MLSCPSVLNTCFQSFLTSSCPRRPRNQFSHCSYFSIPCTQWSFLKQMHARVVLCTDVCNQKGYFDGCMQRTLGQRMRARYGANPGCAQLISRMHATPLIARKGHGNLEYSETHTPQYSLSLTCSPSQTLVSVVQCEYSPFTGGGNRTHVAVPNNLFTTAALYHSATEVLIEFD